MSDAEVTSELNNTAFYVVVPLYLFGMVCLSGISYLKNTSSGVINLGPFKLFGDKTASQAQSFLGAGSGIPGPVLFFSMAATLYSGYSVSGIADEAYTFGFLAIRWIPAGVALYGAMAILAPRMHALGKSRGYLTAGELIFDRYSEPASSPFVPHMLRLVALFCLQLPVFCYLISQFTAVGLEVNRYTGGEVEKLPALITAAVVLLFCSFVGGLRAVAYNDVLQGVMLLVGAVVFFIIQQTELGGLPAVKEYVRSEEYRNVSAFGYGKFNNVPNADGGWSTSAYASFIIKVMIAATMFPHLVMRLFVARSSEGLRFGLAGMSFTFFIVQLSAMITGWVAVASYGGVTLSRGTFGSVAGEVRSGSDGGQFGSALLMTSFVCAALSTADSSLIAFSTMWLRDFYLPYIQPDASQARQVLFARCTAVLGLAVGIWLSVMSIQAKPEPWNLSNLFSLQTVTPIHVAPAVWFGLHWKGLRGEPVLAGMIVGLAVTFGFTFSDLNVKLALGLEETKEGWSPSLIGLCFNIIVTVVGGLLLEFNPNMLPTGPVAQYARPLDLHKVFGEKPDRLINPFLWGVLLTLTALTIPWYRAEDFGKPDTWVGNISLWAFLSLFFTGVLTIAVAWAYLNLWDDYDLQSEPALYPIASEDQQEKQVEEGVAVSEKPEGMFSTQGYEAMPPPPPLAASMGYPAAYPVNHPVIMASPGIPQPAMPYMPAVATAPPPVYMMGTAFGQQNEIKESE
mmetsp:Transcript_21638/g.33861  ORF Transcript_21638/g.33861 Transcript_21638/m.33861 type:complete len:737 (-) Transcript_21638:160-2370(-)|eukprot:CAMPEP_0184290478 /NCGR_PEP_ID=MMETSP1049-20130417/2706_1 /TAXON_ID=77928 /ORGANISM="Proteomonas sulcata, Strain CCMP704" /LENGTH=736 /DNA_ID=CAMNT_0026597637 /DNA_START=130 /DNA_END=2340 /DNA_ORIENTATION=-